MVSAGIIVLSHFSHIFKRKSGLYFTYFWISGDLFDLPKLLSSAALSEI